MYIKSTMVSQAVASGAPRKLTLEEVNLTPQEEADLITKARLDKMGRLNMQAYADHVRNEPSFIIPTAGVLEAAMKRELKELHGWSFDTFNEPQIRALSLYFSQDNGFEKLEEGYSLKKGLMLYGPVGCGKSTLLELMQKNSANPYILVSCRSVADTFAEHGHGAVQMYSGIKTVNKREWMGHESAGYAFDDLGTEENKKNFGNQVNVMQEVLLNRYDSRAGIGMTHLTTNLNFQQIADVVIGYGPRVASRMKEMFNIIAFDDNAPDRRN